MRLRYQVFDVAGNGVGIRAPIIARASNLGWGTQPGGRAPPLAACLADDWQPCGLPRSRASSIARRMLTRTAPASSGSRRRRDYRPWPFLPELRDATQEMRTRTFRKILFAVDRSEHSRAAAPAVARLALLSGADVLVTHVWNMEDKSIGGKCQIEMPGKARELLHEVTGRLTQAGVHAEYELRSAPEDRIAEEIALAAKEYGADLIAIGSRGLSDLRGLFLGSVSHRVIAHTDRPVLVVRHGGHRAGAPIRHILLAVAGGEEVPHAVEAARAIALRAEAQVLVLHVRYLLPSGMGDAFVESEEESAHLIEEIVGRLKKAGVNAEGASLLNRQGVAREIAESASAWNADLVVIGSRRLSDLASIFLGGIGHEVMQLSDRPVLVAERPEPLIGSKQKQG